jgi:hypothetical protein
MARQAVGQNGATWTVGGWLWGGAILSVVLIVSTPTVIVFAFGSLPTIVAWLIDRSKEKFATFCVGGLNICGVFPFLLQIWFEEHSIDAATGIVTDVFAVLIMYASAGFGWALFISVPPVVAAFLNVVTQRRVAFLRDEQKAIVDEWGTTVSESVHDPETVQDTVEAAPAPSEE